MQRKIMRRQGLIGGLLLMVLASGCFQASGDQLQPTEIVSIETWTPVPSITPLEPQTIIVTATLDPFAAQDVATEEVGDFGTGGVDDVVAPVDDSLAQFSTATTQPLALDPDQLRATEIIQGATSTQEFILTSTAQALGIGVVFSTETPTVGFDLGVATPTPGPVVAGADCVDEVVVGDNLFRISQRYGLTVGEIAARNAITNINLIYPGDRLTIPGCGTTGYRPLPTSTPGITPVAGGSTTGGTTGDTSGGIFITFTPAPGGSVPPASTGTCGTVIVAEGQSLFQLALANGTTVDAIAAANGIVNVDLIDMGMTLNIPC